MESKERTTFGASHDCMKFSPHFCFEAGGRSPVQQTAQSLDEMAEWSISVATVSVSADARRSGASMNLRFPRGDLRTRPGYLFDDKEGAGAVCCPPTFS